MIERIPLNKILDDHFCVVSTNRQYNNRDYVTLGMIEYHVMLGGKSLRRNTSLSVFQCRNYKIIQKLQFRYADDIYRCASSAVEKVIDRICFGLGDVRPNAPYLVISKEQLPPTKTAQWLKKNMVSDVIIIEGKNRARVSFSSEEDYRLAQLKFS